MKAKPLIFILIISAAIAVALWQNQQLSRSESPGIVAVNSRLELKRLDVATLYAGRVEEILVQEGEEVLLKQPLARLSSEQSQMQVNTATAQKQRAEEKVAVADSEINARLQQLNLAKLELTNAQKLRKENLISAAELERRLAHYRTATATLEAAKAVKAEALAGVAQAQAQLEFARSQNNDMLIKAPKAGRVEYQIAEPGNVLGAGGKVISLLDPSDIYLNVFLTSAQMNKIKLGDDARIAVEGTDLIFPAKITFVASEAQFTPKAVETSEERAKLMFKVKLQIPPQTALKYQRLLKGGMTALGYVKYDPSAQWTETLNVQLPQGE